MTGLVLAVDVLVAFLFCAEATVCNNFITDTLPHSFIKDEILPFKTIRKPFLVHLTLVVDDPALEVLHVLETVMLQPRTRLLATNTTSAVECDLFILVHFE